MDKCTDGAILDELLNRPTGHLALWGSDGEDDDATSEDEQDKDAKSKSNSEDDEDGEKDDKGAKPKSAEERRLANLEEDRNRNRDGRKAAEQKVKDLEAQIKQMEKDGTPDDALKSTNEELTRTNAAQAQTIQELMLQVAFLTESGYDWVDPQAALSLADLSEVEYDEKAKKVSGLKVALDKLAKDKPYLVKKADKEDEDEGAKPGPRRSGQPPRPGRQKSEGKEAARRSELINKYPALRR